MPALCQIPARAAALDHSPLLAAAALLALAFTVGGTSIWFAPLISEGVCLAVAVVFLTRFWKNPGDLAAK